jgi:hypothetical protein
VRVDEAGSFRDPSGSLFHDDGVLKRFVTQFGAADYRQLISSGLYQQLTEESLLVSHVEEPVPAGSDAAAILVPERIPYISYPYEWCFGQFRDAALVTLRIQELAMERGMSMKDASAFNIQFRGSQPLFIDTLSFEANDSGPWVAYNQFCRHFLAPLLLMSYVSPAFNQFWKASLDGFSLDLVSSLLPRTTYLRLGSLLHVHLHALAQKKYEMAESNGVEPRKSLGRRDPKPGLLNSLRSFVLSLRPMRKETEWLHYYDRKASHYSSAAELSKKTAVQQLVDRVRPQLVYDLGSNVGEYGRLAAASGAYTICFDIDPLCVHHNYERARQDNDQRVLPLLQDLTNPSPGLGFALSERHNVVDRGQADLVMALALIHHLRITGNVPLERIAAFLSRLGDFLLLEYVPKTDMMTQALLRSRKDTFLDYTDEGFRQGFARHFTLQDMVPVAETERRLFLFRRRY